MTKDSKTFVVVLIGPMGCGKTTIGKELAHHLGWPFFDGDDFHPKENKEKMSQSIPLNDDDRQPWLAILRDLIFQHLSKGNSMILACSALKKRYRNTLGIDQQRVISVFLKGSAELLKKRIASRSHEYMAGDLLQSQIETLEVPETGLIVDISGSPEEICNEIVDKLHKKMS